MNPGNNRPAAYDPLPTLLDSPDSYPQKLDLVRSCILQIELDEPAYQAASFLDDRILNPATRGTWLPIAKLAAATKPGLEARPLHFILHTGHVGSTLLSRLLEATGSVLSLREPLPLRTLAEASDVLGLPESLLSEQQFDLVLDTFVRLWSRGYTTTRCVVLKATSAAARVAPWLLRRNAASRAVYLNLRAEPYLATLLAGANSMVDLRGHGPERMRRLRAGIATPLEPLHALTPGKLAAMSWLAESLTRREILDQWPGRVLAVDFDVFLDDLPHEMQQIADHLQLPADPGWLVQVSSSPALARYSKSPDHEYSPALRAQVLDQARRDHRDEIRRGLDWLESLARAESAVARVLEKDPA